MNVFVVGMPVKVFTGLAIIWVTAPLFGDVFLIVANIISDMNLNIIELMTPN
jgi:flagellar biosynthesis protein FliR